MYGGSRRPLWKGRVRLISTIKGSLKGKSRTHALEVRFSVANASDTHFSQKSVSEREFLAKCSDKLETMLELTEVLLESFLAKGFAPGDLKLLSELSVLLGLLRNVSTLSLEHRMVISNSKTLKHLSCFIYIKLGTEEKMGLFSIASYGIIKMLNNSPPEEACYDHAHLKECLLITCRFLQLLANLSVDSKVEYQVSHSREREREKKTGEKKKTHSRRVNPTSGLSV